MKYCNILIQESFLFNQHLTYLCEDFELEIGSRVTINLRGRSMVGFVLDIYEADPASFDFKVYPIQSVIDEKAIINKELLELAHNMSYRTVSPLIKVLQTILPNVLRPRANFQEARLIKGLVFNDLDDKKLTGLQTMFVNKFKDKSFTSIADARAFYTGYDSLVKRDIFRRVEIEKKYLTQDITDTYEVQKLTPQQESIIEKIEYDKAHTYLLHGVTGSGKTEVYLHMAKEVLDKGQQVLFLVPEISLTPQMIDRVSKRFNEDVAIYHSSLNNQEKYEQYVRVQNKETSIVVGTRSALFMPFDNLGLIVLDEEHDTSYKQSNTPMYHAADVAEFRSIYHQCPLILGSASPRLESYARALKGVYTLLELPTRINGIFPKVTIIDTKKNLYAGKSSLLSDTLLNGIQDRLDKKEQVILLLNRRGYMTFLKDKETDQVLMCPHCDVSLNYHKVGRLLKCHQCDYTSHMIPKGKDDEPLDIVGSGVGTQRLTEYLQSKFPDANIGRMDRDTTKFKGSHEKILTDFTNKVYDILVGTQMIAKGLDIENVTLVGIMNIDHTLAYEDFRSVEHSFDLILQATGRSGRGQYPGEVMIQTFNKDHYAIKFGVYNQYKRFFNQEMQYRKLASYPPYSYLTSILFSAESEKTAHDNANTFLKLLEKDGIRIIGPSTLYKLANRHRVRIILKTKDLNEMIDRVNHAVSIYYTLNKGGISVDVNPLTLN